MEKMDVGDRQCWNVVLPTDLMLMNECYSEPLAVLLVVLGNELSC